MITGHKRAMGFWPPTALAMTVGRGESDLLESDFESFRRQALLFALLNLLLIGALLALQEISRLVRGRPSGSVVVVLTVGFVVQAAHLTWLQLRNVTPFAPQAADLHVLVPRLQLSARARAHFHHHKR